MLAAISAWTVTPMVLVFFILGLLTFIFSIYIGIKYKDIEIFLCFVLASLILSFMALFFGMGKLGQIPTNPPKIILYDQNAHVINNDTNIIIEYNIKDEG